MRLSAASALFVGLVCAASAQDPKGDDKPASKPPKGWKEHKGGLKSEAYTVWLPPGALDDKMSSIITKKGQIAIHRTVVTTKAGAVYGAGQIILPPELTNALLKDRQDFFRDLFLDEVNGTLVEEKRIKIGIMPGKEYLADTPKGMARMQLIGPGVIVYRVLAVGTKDQIKSADTQAFFDAFVCRENRDPKKDTTSPAAPAKKDAPGSGAVAKKDRVELPFKAAFKKPETSTTPTSYLKLVSEPDDSIGQGKKYDFKGPDLKVVVTERGVTVGADEWILDVEAPGTQFLKVGEYQDAKRHASADSPGLQLMGEGRGSNTIAGAFVVWELEVKDKKVVRLAVDFEQHSEGKLAGLTGKLRINSTLK